MSIEKKTPLEIVGYVLRHARANSGLTIREASNIIGIPCGRLSQIECGKGELMTVTEIESYANFLRIKTIGDKS